MVPGNVASRCEEHGMEELKRKWTSPTHGRASYAAHWQMNRASVNYNLHFRASWGCVLQEKNPLAIILKYTIYIYTNDSSEIL